MDGSLPLLSLAPGSTESVWAQRPLLCLGTSRAAPPKGGQGCLPAQPESMRGPLFTVSVSLTRERRRRRATVSITLRSSGLPLPHPAARGWSQPCEGPQALTPALLSWPSSQTSSPHRGLSASLPACWPVRGKAKVRLRCVERGGCGAPNSKLYPLKAELPEKVTNSHRKKIYLTHFTVRKHALALL